MGELWYTNQHMKNPWVVIGIIAVVLFGGSFWYASISAEKNNEGIEIVDHIKGSDEASVTLVKYSDFLCGACASAQPAVQQVLELHGDDIRYEYRHFPFLSATSRQAAIAVEAAGQQGKFYEFHDLVFENQTAVTQSRAPQALFIQYAEQLELDVDLFRRHLNSSMLKSHVEEDFAAGRALNVTGTPTFFLNGERMVIESYADFVIQIGEAVANASDTASSSDTKVTEAVMGDEIEFGF